MLFSIAEVWIDENRLVALSFNLSDVQPRQTDRERDRIY